MKRLSLVIILAVVLVFWGNTIAYAAPQEALSGNELTEWIIENVEPTYHQGKTEETPFSGDSGTIYTDQHIVYMYNATFEYYIGQLRSQCWWVIDMNRNIKNYNCSHSASPAPGTNYVAYSELGGAYLAAPDNARITISGTWSDYIYPYSAHQVYNLRGDGGYEYRVFE